MAVFKNISTILNIVQSVLALALAGVSLWFFIELKSITDLRNRDRFLLDFELHWPQIIPWLIIIVCVLVVIISLCGIYSGCANKKSLIITYTVFLSIIAIAAFASGILGLINRDTKDTEDFIDISVREAYTETKYRSDVVAAFGNIERRMRCCGNKGSSDYTSVSIPETCCDKDELVTCESSASRRLGCLEVVTKYTQIFMLYTSIGSLAIGVLCLASVLVSILLIVCSKSRKNRLKAEAEKEPLKLPL